MKRGEADCVSNIVIDNRQMDGWMEEREGGEGLGRGSIGEIVKNLDFQEKKKKTKRYRIVYSIFNIGILFKLFISRSVIN